MVNIGIVGVGFMGVTHFKAMPKVRGGKVAAIVTRDEKNGAVIGATYRGTSEAAGACRI